MFGSGGSTNDLSPQLRVRPFRRYSSLDKSNDSKWPPTEQIVVAAARYRRMNQTSEKRSFRCPEMRKD